MEKIVLYREKEEFGLIETVMKDFRKYRLKLYTFMVFVVFLTLIILLVIPNEYTATTRIMPYSESPTDKLSELASSLIPSELLSSVILSGSKSEGDYLKGLFVSNQVIDAVLERQYTNLRTSPDGDLYQLFDINNKQYARDELLSRVSINKNSKSGILSISALTNDPVLSSQIANECVTQIDNFKRELNVIAARENKRFYSERLEHFKVNLVKAKEQQAAFLLKNRNYFSATDPVLRQKVAEFKEQLYFYAKIVTGMKQLLIAAETQISRDTPSLKLIETAEIPLLKSGPPRSKYLIISLFGSFLFGFGLIILKNAYKWHFPDKTRKELSSSINIIRADINSVVRRLRINQKDKVLK